jgi:protein-tyrosine phosphatase
MLFRNWRKNLFSGLPFNTDMHSHLLPAVDDGASNVEESIALIQGLCDLGYKNFVTTPHIYQDIYPNSPETLRPAHASLMSALEAAGLDVGLRFAAEYFLDDHLQELLKEGREKILTVYDNCVLVETSFTQLIMGLDDRLFELQAAGYKPILAHPERYGYWHAEKDQFHTLKERGILLQVNLLSLIGYYGRSVAETARYLVRQEIVDLVGTDCHHERHIGALRNGAKEILQILDPLIRKDKLLNNRIF